MKQVLLDTHMWAWSLSSHERLSAGARSLLEKAEHIFISPISFFEIGQKVRLGKWPEMEPFVRQLPELAEQQGGQIAALSPAICLRAAMLDWIHLDPFDRFLAATAIEYGIPLLSADDAFDTLPKDQGSITRIY